MSWFFIALGAPFLYSVVTHLDKYLIHRFKKDKTEERGVGGLILYSALFGEVIKAHHGRIWAESDGVSKGTKVNVELPINI